MMKTELTILSGISTIEQMEDNLDTFRALNTLSVQGAKRPLYTEGTDLL